MLCMCILIYISGKNKIVFGGSYDALDYGSGTKRAVMPITTKVGTLKGSTKTSHATPCM